MATIGTAITLMDFQRRLDPNDKIAALIELMNDINEVIPDIPFQEGNLPVGHLTTVRTGLPSATWRQLNYGVQPSKSTTKQVQDTCGMLEAYAEIDRDLSKLNGNSAAFRLSEDAAFLETMNQDFASTLFYGNTANAPTKFMGLAPRFDTPSTDDTLAGFNMVDGGAADGVTTCTSVWLVVWGSNTVHGIFPKGSKAGFDMQDLGEVTKTLADGSMLQVLRSHYKWDCGLTVRDWRYAVRICNINKAALTSNSSPADLVKLMVHATEKIPNMGGGRACFYANRTIRSYLRDQILAKAQYNLTYETVAGKPVTMLDGIPVRRCDALLNTETAIADAAGSFAD